MAATRDRVLVAYTRFDFALLTAAILIIGGGAALYIRLRRGSNKEAEL